MVELEAMRFAPLARKFDKVSRDHHYSYVCIIVLVAMTNNACRHTYQQDSTHSRFTVRDTLNQQKTIDLFHSLRRLPYIGNGLNVDFVSARIEFGAKHVTQMDGWMDGETDGRTDR